MSRKIGVAFAALALMLVPVVAGAAPARNIVQVAREAGSFKTLLAAIEAADLTGALSGQGKGPLTVFAPTDDAFAKLPAGTVESLLKDKAALRNILLYHVAAGELKAADVVARTSVTMLNGRSVTISTAGGVKVNDANVVKTDIAARNGVIHVIDTVLLP